MLETIILDTLKKYSDANLQSDSACQLIAKEVCDKWDNYCRIPEKRWSKQDAATKEA